MPSAREEIQQASILLREAGVKVAKAQLKVKDKRLQEVLNKLNDLANVYSLGGGTE